ncbi:MAG: hypothetical protein H0U49_10565 [Parachlamydiaceae bacterium]|nr:hypothetical protein [Parachlamydiaceae bacterium]
MDLGNVRNLKSHFENLNVQPKQTQKQSSSETISKAIKIDGYSQDVFKTRKNAFESETKEGKINATVNELLLLENDENTPADNSLNYPDLDKEFNINMPKESKPPASGESTPSQKLNKLKPQFVKSLKELEVSKRSEKDSKIDAAVNDLLELEEENIDAKVEKLLSEDELIKKFEEEKSKPKEVRLTPSEQRSKLESEIVNSQTPFKGFKGALKDLDVADIEIYTDNSENLDEVEAA